MSDLVCYCFEYTAADIEKDLKANHGQSRILQKIIKEKRAGGCQCSTLHPESR